MRTQDFFNFIRERHAIYVRRKEGQPKPWTADPILQSYRFCNVYRELDTVTQWIAENWRNPHTDERDVWFAMVVARLVNWPDTLTEIGYPVPWNQNTFIQIMEARKKAGEKVFTGAYIISTGGWRESKAHYVADGVLTPMWERRGYIFEATNSLARFHERLMEFNGMGSFMAGQIVCDTKYTHLLDIATDWWQWACSGPGSRRGLARVFDKPVNYKWKEDEWFVALHKLKASVDPLIFDTKMPPIHAQDLQSCLCEFDKYERTRLGEGRPRNNYPGK